MWYSVTIFWKTGEISTVWIKDEEVARTIANDILEQNRNLVEKIRIAPAR